MGMGKDLVKSSPEAAALFAKADAALDIDVQAICFEGPEERLTKTDACQPALYVHGLALWTALGEKFPNLKINAAAGLSLGEFTAHTAAGHWSFETGLELVYLRGRLMQQACEATDGGMLTLIGATPEQARELASRSGLEVANVNCPGQIVLSGPRNHMAHAVENGKQMGLKRVVPLKVAGAYHSALMASAQDGLKQALEKAELSEGQASVYANINGKPANDGRSIRDTLHEQVTGSVLWQKCIEQMIHDGIEQFIELGPGKILTGMVRRICPDIPCLSAGNAEELTRLEIST